jgi:predicted Zn finger-like uncharacterized protein
MLTRCSHCGTAFRVYEHQLEKREGQVRCGACGEVFDAYTSLEAEREAARAADAPAAPLAAAPIAAPAAPPPTFVEASREGSGGDVLVHPSDPASPPPNAEETVTDPDPSYVSGDGGDYDFGPAGIERDRRPAYIGAIVVAGALLLVQSVVWFRSELAARFPPLRGPLEAVCRVVACQVTLPTMAEYIAIESSDLQSDGEYLVLVAILRNKAGFTQAFPAVELTLTDAREQPVARRILSPEDYLDPTIRPATGVGAGAEVLARVYIDAKGLNATNYRMLVFYP